MNVSNVVPQIALFLLLFPCLCFCIWHGRITLNAQYHSELSLLNPKTRLRSCFILVPHWLQRWIDRFAETDCICSGQEGDGTRMKGMKIGKDRTEVLEGRRGKEREEPSVWGRGGWMGDGARGEEGRLIKWGPYEGGGGEKGSGRGPLGGKSESVELYIPHIPAPLLSPTYPSC